MSTKRTHWDGKLLGEKRRKFGLTQAKLSEMSGITRAEIANVESGRRHLSTNDALELWSALASVEAKRRRVPLASLKSGAGDDSFLSQSADCAMMALEAAAGLKQTAMHEIRDAKSTMDLAKIKHDGAVAWLAELKSREDKLKAFVPH